MPVQVKGHVYPSGNVMSPNSGSGCGAGNTATTEKELMNPAAKPHLHCLGVPHSVATSHFVCPGTSQALVTLTSSTFQMVESGDAVLPIEKLPPDPISKGIDIRTGSASCVPCGCKTIMSDEGLSGKGPVPALISLKSENALIATSTSDLNAPLGKSILIPPGAVLGDNVKGS